jgi:hypothetical protein
MDSFAEMAATGSKTSRKLTARNCLAEIFQLKYRKRFASSYPMKERSWRKTHQMKPSHPGGSHFETFAQLREQF